jgi:hypothetical protein
MRAVDVLGDASCFSRACAAGEPSGASRTSAADVTGSRGPSLCLEVERRGGRGGHITLACTQRSNAATPTKMNVAAVKLTMVTRIPSMGTPL